MIMDLRMAYFLFEDLKLRERRGLPHRHGEGAVERKQAMRKAMRGYDKVGPKFRTLSAYGDSSGYFREDFNHVLTEEEKENYIEVHEIPLSPSLYDCTGQMFTLSINFYVVGGNRTVVIHRVDFDV